MSPQHRWATIDRIAADRPFYSGKHRNLSAGQQAVNVAHARIRAVGEQAMAALKSWRLLRKLRCSTTRITGLVRAVLTLHIASA